jgi:hypothetical protein
LIAAIGAGWLVAVGLGSAAALAADIAADGAALAAGTPSPAGSPNVSHPSSFTTETVVVPESTAVAANVEPAAPVQPSTTEIPQAALATQASPGAPGRNSDAEIVNYARPQQVPLMEPRLHSLQEFINEGTDDDSPLGIEVRESQRRLRSGVEVNGLLIVGVESNSPAATAGLLAYRRVARDVLEGAAVLASLVFPPAAIAVPLFDQVRIGETYDLIIAVDATRVTNFLDFEDRMRDVQPGEIVYLSIIRNGDRRQVAVQLPSTPPPSRF